MKCKSVMAALAGGFIFAMSAQAHHSFTATYDERQQIRIEGTLVAFHFRNPHASVDVLAEDENGEMVRWSIEWGGAGQLASQGVTRELLKAGDHVVITGSPSRNAELHRMRMQSLRRPSDGYGWGFEGESFD